VAYPFSGKLGSAWDSKARPFLVQLESPWRFHRCLGPFDCGLAILPSVTLATSLLERSQPGRCRTGGALPPKLVNRWQFLVAAISYFEVWKSFITGK